MFTVVALYKFVRLAPEQVVAIQETVRTFCTEREIRGLFLLGPEGCNGTMAGPPAAMEAFVPFLEAMSELGPMTAKWSRCDFQPFERLKVDIRDEIVTLKRPDIYPEAAKNNHLSPEEWHRVLATEEEVLLLDTRNDYETEIGMFRGAVDPKIEHFSQFPDYVKSQNIPRDRKILMYCTGGIRCEKALLYMKQEGYENVFQLDGGILNYLEKFPDGFYEGECFVFDQRIAVDNHLRPSQRYHRCPHCGDPAQHPVTCAYCGEEGVVCPRCATVPHFQACSKNCAYHLRLREPSGEVAGSE
jgi:UPF0176 protein